MSNRNELLSQILNATQNIDQGGLSNRVLVTQPSDLQGSLNSTVEYFLDGHIDMTGAGFSIEVPQGGLNITGYNFDLSSLSSTDAAYDLFTSPVGGSGNIIFKDFAISVSGAGSRVFGDVTSDTGSEAIEITGLNYNNCASLGNLSGYRQMLETGTGRFGGTPELTFSGSWSGARISTSLALGMSDFSSLFKAGAGLTFSGRFISGMNCDLPSVGAFLDFAPANISNDESLQLNGCRVTRQGAINADDATIIPNITQADEQSIWRNNVGIKNTKKYIKANVTAEALTAMPLQDNYYPLLGTFTVEDSEHFEMISNGEFRLKTGNGKYEFIGNIEIEGTANDLIDISVTKSTDDGATYPTEIQHLRRPINNLVGSLDLAFFNIAFIDTLSKGDRVRIEAENKTRINGDVTMLLDSYFMIKEV